MNKIIIPAIIVFGTISAATASDYVAPSNYYERNVSNCNKSNLYRELDDASRTGRAVLTVVKCESGFQYNEELEVRHTAQPRRMVQVQQVAQPCYDCNPSFEVVKDRKYFVTETREVYKPVVKYVSAGTYTTTSEVCGNNVHCN